MTVDEVYDYWNAHTLGLQYVTDEELEVGSPAFFADIRPWTNPNKSPWINDLERLVTLDGFRILESASERYRVLLTGLRQPIQEHNIRLLYNLIPRAVAKHSAHKLSVAAVRV
jgi:hypothetical protein